MMNTADGGFDPDSPEESPPSDVARPEDLAAPLGPPARRVRLVVEFLAFYLVAPMALAFLAPAHWMWPMLLAGMALGMVLLVLTPGFHWSELRRGPLAPAPASLAAAFVLAGAGAVILTLWLAPSALFVLPKFRTELWLAILVLYPLLSAVPQEVVFRVLFFRRYGALFPNSTSAIAVNALVFGLAHVFLFNWVAPLLTAAGGALFSLAYLSGRGRNFLYAVLLHAVAGCWIFTAGLGRFFYHGAVGP